MKNQIKEMLNLQDKINEKVHADWKTQNFEWYRAIWVECAELLDHYGWKWWKKQIPNTGQIHLELVDIWHFGLSVLLMENNKESCIEIIESTFMLKIEQGNFKLDLEQFTSDTLITKGFDLKGFFKLMIDINLTFEDLYVGYISKNVLNTFRQDNGYQTGTYIKNWDGIEDNEYLISLALKLDPNNGSFSSDLYDAMKKAYKLKVESV